MKIKIAFLTSEYVTENNYDGGLSNYLYRVTKGLKLRGHEVDVFVISDKNETIEKDGVTIHRVIPEAKWYAISCRIFGKFLSGFRWLLLESYSLEKRFMETYKDNTFDIVQIPTYRASGIFLTFQNKIPITTRISSYRKLWNEAYERKRNFDIKFQEWLESIEMKRSFKVYAPSKFLANKLIKDLNIRVDVVKPIFFIEVDQYKDEIYIEKLKGKQYIIFFGTIGRLKGVFVFNDALKQVLKDNKNMNVVFVGKDTPYGNNMKCMEKIKEELSEYKDRMYHFNSLPHSELYPILMNSKVVVIPSLVDNIPNTCLEAMAHGCIVVASNGASLDELIEDGESGILFKLGDPVSLAEKILFAWNLPDSERRRISDNAKKAIEKLAPEIALKELEDYYIKAIEEWKGKK